MPTSAPGKANPEDARGARVPPVIGRAEARPATAHSVRSAGFTLIELVVVLLILTIILSLVGVRLTRDRGDIVRDEAQKLAVLLANAREQAILESRPYGFVPTAEGYRFLELDDRYRLVPARGDALLRERVLPPLVRLAPVAAPDERGPREAQAGADLILFDPTGDFAAFTLKLESDGIVWYVHGDADGQILPTPFLQPSAG